MSRRPEDYSDRFYRRSISPPSGLRAFEVRYQQTDLWILSDRELEEEAQRLMLEARYQIESYARADPLFLSSHEPLASDPLAPKVVQWMLDAGQEVGVGPMAGVAGAVARYVGEGLSALSREVVVENGGDLYLRVSRGITVGIFAGESPLSGRIGVRIHPDRMPLGMGTSSAAVGHSWSYGAADAACVLSPDPVLADAAATALCNRVGTAGGPQQAVRWAMGIPKVVGCLVIQGRILAVQGEMELVPIELPSPGPLEGD